MMTNTIGPRDRRLVVLVALLVPIVGGLGATAVWLAYSTIAMPDFSPAKSESYVHVAMLALLAGTATLCVAAALRNLMRQRS